MGRLRREPVLPHALLLGPGWGSGHELGTLWLLGLYYVAASGAAGPPRGLSHLPTVARPLGAKQGIWDAAEWGGGEPGCLFTPSPVLVLSLTVFHLVGVCLRNLSLC